LDLMTTFSTPSSQNQHKLGVPLRQSPASALPPILQNEDDRSTFGSGYFRNEYEEYEPLNPDIDRPSPPRAGASRLFENPFDLTDEDSKPVEPKKLSPSHVFESNSLEESILFLENTGKVNPHSMHSPGVNEESDTFCNEAENSERIISHSPSMNSEISSKRPFDTRTFVIRRSPPASVTSSSNESEKRKSATVSILGSPILDDTGSVGNLSLEDGLPIGAEAATADSSNISNQKEEIQENPEDAEVAMEMDYDNLMAYFESLKESNA